MELSGTPSVPTARQVPEPATTCILVVDDEPTVLELTARMLGAAGYAVVEASNAREALRLLERGDPPINLVVTDVVMPETDGRALGRLIAERHLGLPVAYMSATRLTTSCTADHQGRICRFSASHSRWRRSSGWCNNCSAGRPAAIQRPHERLRLGCVSGEGTRLGSGPRCVRHDAARRLARAAPVRMQRCMGVSPCRLARPTWLRTPTYLFIEHLSHPASQHLRSERLLEECGSGIQRAVVHDRVVSVSRHVEHSNAGP